MAGASGRQVARGAPREGAQPRAHRLRAATPPPAPAPCSGCGGWGRRTGSPRRRRSRPPRGPAGSPRPRPRWPGWRTRRRGSRCGRERRRAGRRRARPRGPRLGALTDGMTCPMTTSVHPGRVDLRALDELAHAGPGEVEGGEVAVGGPGFRERACGSRRPRPRGRGPLERWPRARSYVTACGGYRVRPGCGRRARPAGRGSRGSRRGGSPRDSSMARSQARRAATWAATAFGAPVIISSGNALSKDAAKTSDAIAGLQPVERRRTGVGRRVERRGGACSYRTTARLRARGSAGAAAAEQPVRP